MGKEYIKMIEADICYDFGNEHRVETRWINPIHIISTVDVYGSYYILLVNGEHGYISANTFKETFGI